MSKVDYDRRSIQKLNGVIESQRGEIRALAGDEQLRRDQQLLHEQLQEQNRDLREAHMKSLNEMEELERFQGSTFSMRKLIEDRDTILELTSQDSGTTEWSWLSEWFERILKMLDQYAVDIPTLPVNLCLSHLIQFLVECYSVLWECRAATMGRQAFGTRMVFRKLFFLQIQRRLLLLQHLIRKSPILGSLMYHIRTHITTCDEWKQNTSSGSEMPVRTVSH